MSYPLSTAVSSGQPTAADHYNNLRSDALYLGQIAADGVTLGSLFSKEINNFTLAYLATSRLRVSATPTAPVWVVVDGVILTATSNVDLSVGLAPSGAANMYYVFAVRTAGQTTFSIDINTTATDTTGRRKVGSFYWDGSAIVQASIRTDYQDSLNTVLPLQSQLDMPCNGRLTLATGNPLNTSDTASAGTLYFTPYKGNKLALYVPGLAQWKNYTFTEVSLSLAAIADATNYDVFIYDLAGTLTLSLEAWASDTTRSVSLTWQDGVYVRAGQVYKRYLGTIRASGTGVCADSVTIRYVWNYYNQELRYMRVAEGTSHTYNGGDRNWNNSTTNNNLAFVLGMIYPFQIYVRAQIKAGADSSMAQVRLCINTASTGSALQNQNIQYTAVSEVFTYQTATPGYFYLNIQETGNHASSTFYSMTSGVNLYA